MQPLQERIINKIKQFYVKKFIDRFLVIIFYRYHHHLREADIYLQKIWRLDDKGECLLSLRKVSFCVVDKCKISIIPSNIDILNNIYT